jgi:PTS system galactitol-specific IIA component
MQYKLVDLLCREHVLANLDASDAQAAIRDVNGVLVLSGHTLAEFADDACAREVTFPTGLPTRPVAVAMPHADPDHVQASAVGIASLRSPVQFGQMGTDGSVKLDVHLIFLLAIKEREKQVEMIQQLMGVIQNQSLLAALLKAADSETMFNLIQESIGR